MLKLTTFEKRPSLYELATRSSAIAILGAGGLRYDGASRAGAGTLPPGPTAGHARRANRASTRFTSVEQASEEGVEEGVQAWALAMLLALLLLLRTIHFDTFLDQGSSFLPINLFGAVCSIDQEGKCIFLRLIAHSGADGISSPMSLSDQKDTFAVMPNSHFFGMPKRDFARRIGLFEKPNGHFPRGSIA